jgi:hypothetical protein
MKEFTATRNMRFVVALYSIFKICASSDEDCGAGTTEYFRVTSCESSGSTWMAFKAVAASLDVGNGMSRVLQAINTSQSTMRLRYRAHGRRRRGSRAGSRYWGGMSCIEHGNWASVLAVMVVMSRASRGCGWITEGDGGRVLGSGGRESFGYETASCVCAGS